MAALIISPNTALLIIDMQQGIHHPRLGRRNNPGAEDQMAALLQAWRTSARPVVHIRHISRSPDSVFWPGQPGVEFQQRFVPLPSEHVMEKNVPDAFANSGLEHWLRLRAVNQLVIVGVITNNSVESSARSAGNLGFDVIVPEDAAFTFDKPDYTGQLRSAEEVHAMSLANLQGEYARVVTVAEVLSGL